MAIVESKFIKDNPQLRSEVEQEIRFANVPQQEAESKVARKHNLPTPRGSNSGHKWNDPAGAGRWIKMLKTDKGEEVHITWLSPEKIMGWVDGHGPYTDTSISEYMRKNSENKYIETISNTHEKKMAGAVTAGHAGIESKPRYGRKKKKEELKKAKPSVKKKRLIRVNNLLIDQETGDEVERVQKAYLNWKQECGISLSDIGITGRGSSDGKGNDSLFEHVRDHVIPRVQRDGASAKDGAKQTIARLESAILHEDSLLDEDDEDTIQEFRKDILAMSGGDEDPRNIPFTQPTNIITRGGKKQDSGDEKVFGHYRTPIYVKSRIEVHGSKNEQGAVKASWYSSDENTAEPPFWQAIFAKSSVSNSTGDTVTIGLLGILENFEKALGNAFLQEVIINDTGDFQAKIDTLSKLTPLKRAIIRLMKDKRVYKGDGHQVLYGGANGIKTLLNDTTFKGNTQASKYLAEVAPDLKQIKGSEDIKEFKIKFTDATINRMINLWVRPQFVVPPHLGPNGKPFLLSNAGGGRKVTGQSWSNAYQTALDKSKIKKSWYDGLWG